MKKYVIPADLQRKGLVVLQLLGKACFKDTHPALLRDLAQIVARAMEKHPKDRALREEVSNHWNGNDVILTGEMFITGCVKCCHFDNF